MRSNCVDRDQRITATPLTSSQPTHTRDLVSTDRTDSGVLVGAAGCRLVNSQYSLNVVDVRQVDTLAVASHRGVSCSSGSVVKLTDCRVAGRRRCLTRYRRLDDDVVTLDRRPAADITGLTVFGVHCTVVAADTGHYDKRLTILTHTAK